MLYCKTCMRFTEKEVCPRCGNKKLKQAEKDDPVYLMTREAIMAYAIEEILDKNHIPFMKKGLVGAGITSRIGFTKEIYEFFVPLSFYEKAKEVLSNFLEED